MRHIEDPTIESSREVTHHDGPITGSLRREESDISNVIASGTSAISTAMTDDMILNEIVAEQSFGSQESVETGFTMMDERFEPTY